MTNEQFQLEVVDRLGRIETTQGAVAKLVQKHDTALERLVVESEVSKHATTRTAQRYAGGTAFFVALLEALRHLGLLGK